MPTCSAHVQNEHVVRLPSRLQGIHVTDLEHLQSAVPPHPAPVQPLLVLPLLIELEPHLPAATHENHYEPSAKPET